ncbi:MAG: rRNA maturation RNase YbeY [Gammaproteobacteria bacterium]|nr:rRNA maturation RNase YbeY [Gammaproteobacteria bacterium]
MMDIDVQYAVSPVGLPSEQELIDWASLAIPEDKQDVSMTVRIVDEQESAQLNATYRHKQGPTNVLSFPTDIPAEVESNLLGDLVICAPVVMREAKEQGKAATAHWAHMVIHGTLHLQGYDHQTDKEAQKMEEFERNILIKIGFNDPYKEI